MSDKVGNLSFSVLFFIGSNFVAMTAVFACVCVCVVGDDWRKSELDGDTPVIY